MDHTEEEIILDNDEDRDDYVIDKEEVNCAGFRKPSREIIPD